MVKYECTVCGYIYDPALGDPDGSIEPGTSFEEIPMTGYVQSSGQLKMSLKRWSKMKPREIK